MSAKQKISKQIHKLLLLITISALLLTACGNAKQTIAEKETSITETMETENSVEEIYLQEDGTYYVSEEVRQKFKSYEILDELTEEEFEEFLQMFLEEYYPEEQSVDVLLYILETAIEENIKNTEIAESEPVENTESAAIVKDPVHGLICSQEMADAIQASLERANLDNKWAGNILNRYYEIGDLSKVDREIIDNLVDSLKKELTGQQEADKAQQQQNQNQGGNNGNNGGSGSSNNGGGSSSGGNSNEAPDDWVTPEIDTPPSEPGPGEITIDITPGKGGDGGELIGDTVLNP